VLSHRGVPSLPTCPSACVVAVDVENWGDEVVVKNGGYSIVTVCCGATELLCHSVHVNVRCAFARYETCTVIVRQI